VYSNPNYGKRQREHVQQNESLRAVEEEKSFQTIIDDPEPEVEVFSQDSTQILLPPIISDSALSLEEEESDTYLEAIEDTEEEYEIPDPGLAAREYTRRLSTGPKGETIAKRDSENMVCTTPGADGPSTPLMHIPCDSWITMALRILPGNLVPDGMVIFVPLLLTIVSLVTLIFL